MRWDGFRPIVVTTIGALFTLACTGGDAVAPRQEPAARIAPHPTKELSASVTLSDTAGSIAVGQTKTLTATFKDWRGRVVERPLTWSTSNKAVATVTSDGVVTGISPGTADITAQYNDASSTTTITVRGTGSNAVTVTPNAGSVAIGQTLQLTAAAHNQSNETVKSASFTWTSSPTTVATVSSSGLVTGVAAGTAHITVKSSTGVTTSIDVTVTGAAAVSTVVVTLNSSSLTVGQTTQAVAVVKDAQGKTMTGQSITYASSNAAVASVSASGVATAVSSGTTNIVATSGGKSGSAGLTVTGAATPTPPPIGGPTASAALPATTVSTAPTPVTGKSIAVHAGGNLQAALNSANRGDEIVLDAGATFTGTFTLPAKSGSSANGWITVRTSALSSLPAPGTRVSPANASAMPKLVTPNTTAALQTAPSASGWRLIGVELTSDPSYTAYPNYGLVLLGDGSSAQNSLSIVPRDLILDRVYIHGQPNTETKRCVALNSGATAIVDSYLSDCKGKGYDTQAIAGWNGPGPYLIQNNRLEGGAENILFGGADPYIPNLIPSDITIRQNYLHKPMTWKGVYTGKNLFELKNAQRVLAEGNVLRNNWIDAQSGFAIVWGSVNQSGACSWCIVQDVTFRSNWVDSVSAAFNLFEGYAGSQYARRFAILNNLLTNVGVSSLGSNGRMYLVQGHLDDVAIENNTGFSPYAYLQFGDQTAVPKNRFSWRNNIGGNSMYNLQSPLANGGKMFTTYCGTSYTAVGNVVVGAVTGLPTGNVSVPTVSALGIINAVTPLLSGTWTLSASSPYYTAGQNGSVPGIVWSTLTQITAGVDR